MCIKYVIAVLPDILAVSVCNAGLMSVFGQNLANIGQALTLLDTSVNSQYDIRGQPRSDKVNFIHFVHHVSVLPVMSH